MPKKPVKAHSRTKDGKTHKVRASMRDVAPKHAKINSAIEKLRKDRETEYEKIKQLRAPYDEYDSQDKHSQELGLPPAPRKEMSSKVKAKIAEHSSRAEYHDSVISKLHEKKRKMMDASAERAANNIMRSGLGKGTSSAGSAYIDVNTNYIQSN